MAGNPDVNERYVSVYKHRGIDICTLKEAVPSNGDFLGYVIDHSCFMGRKYDHPENAMEDIDANWHLI